MHSSTVQSERWQRLVDRVRENPGVRFEDQWREFQAIFADRDDTEGPPVVWSPSSALMRESNIALALDERGFGSYDEFHEWSCREREDFWRFVIARLGVVFQSPPERVLDPSGSPSSPRWLPGARLNCVDSCFRAEPTKTAIVSGREDRTGLERLSYGELERQVDRVARGLLERDFRSGDGIALYLPMTIECVAAYLGVIRAGCHVISIADSFPPPEVERRLRIGKARGIITVDSYQRAGKTIELYRGVRKVAGPRAIVIPTDPGRRQDLRRDDLLWQDLLAGEEPYPSNSAKPDDLTNVLFSSGTTGDPKAIPWTHLTSIKAAMDGHFHQDIRTSDVLAWPTNIGWMMGPWLIYATLMNGATMALYQGVPTREGFVRFVAEADVTVLGVVPSLVRAWRALGMVGDEWNGVRVFSSTGEPSNVEDYLWLMSRTGYRAPVIEYCGGTEIGGGYITGTVVESASPSTFTTPALGLDLVLIDEDGNLVGGTGTGEAFLVPPSIGLSERLLNRDHDEVYYTGCPAGPKGECLRRHGDRIARLPGGFYSAQGRADDTMNLGGIKVGSLEIETALASHPAVAESAAVGVRTGGAGAERLVIYAKLATEITLDRLRKELAEILARRLNPLFKIHDLIVMEKLPRTASNKLIRRELRDRYATNARDAGSTTVGEPGG
jgi:acetyl-CoA synthetase